MVSPSVIKLWSSRRSLALWRITGMPSGPWSYAKTSVCREPASTTKALGIETRAANLTGEMHLGGSEEGESEER